MPDINWWDFVVWMFWGWVFCGAMFIICKAIDHKGRNHQRAGGFGRHGKVGHYRAGLSGRDSVCQCSCHSPLFELGKPAGTFIIRFDPPALHDRVVDSSKHDRQG
jgi:hypothetical protein